MIMDLGFCWASSRRHAEAPCEQHCLYHQHQNITVAQWGNSHHFVKSFNQLSSRISRLRWAYLAPITTSTRRRPMRAGWRRTSTWRWTQIMIELLNNFYWRWTTPTSSSAPGVATPVTRTDTRLWCSRWGSWSLTRPPWCCWAWWASSTSASPRPALASPPRPPSPVTSASSLCCFRGIYRLVSS